MRFNSQMTPIELHRLDPARNMYRFHLFEIEPDLFGGFRLLRSLWRPQKNSFAPRRGQGGIDFRRVGALTEAEFSTAPTALLLLFDRPQPAEDAMHHFVGILVVDHPVSACGVVAQRGLGRGLPPCAQPRPVSPSLRRH